MLDPAHADPALLALQTENAQLHAQIAQLQAALQDAVVLQDDDFDAFASTAQAEGVSLPVARRLLQT